MLAQMCFQSENPSHWAPCRHICYAKKMAYNRNMRAQRNARAWWQQVVKAAVVRGSMVRDIPLRLFQVTCLTQAATTHRQLASA